MASKENSRASLHWLPMEMSYVGNVGAVMQRKSGPRQDSAFFDTTKRGV